MTNASLEIGRASTKVALPPHERAGYSTRPVPTTGLAWFPMCSKQSYEIGTGTSWLTIDKSSLSTSTT